MYYTVRHLTRFRYSNPISQSIMELRLQPRTEGNQRCLNFQVSLIPQARTQSYFDYNGNCVHHFDIPGPHRQLNVVAQAQVEVRQTPPLPEALTPVCWDELDQTEYEYLLPSHFVYPTPLLDDLRAELRIEQRDDPLTLLRDLNRQVYEAFDYDQESTTVDSPIDDALRLRKGVCQDFTHIMLGLVRSLGIPARYVSGYILPREGTRSTPGASHAWLEVKLPRLGWVSFDPTNNLVASDRHIRVAIGRDYQDVPPTRGVFKGTATTELTVSVRVAQVNETPEPDPPLPEGWGVLLAAPPLNADELYEQQQQQQQ